MGKHQNHQKRQNRLNPRSHQRARNQKHQNISMSRVLRTHLSLQNGSLVKVNHTNTKLTRANTSHGGDLTLVLVHAVDDLDPTLDQVNIKVNDLELHHGLDH